MKTFLALTSATCLALGAVAGPGLTYEGKTGPGGGKHIVFLAGDEEYRSEEGLPMLAQILAVHHGFKCTVLFSMNPETGEIDPNNQTNIPGIEALDTADLVVMLWRFRELPDDAMKHFVDCYLAGKPFVALRTSTHAFSYTRDPKSPYAKYDWRSKEWPGGFGRQVLGDTWINHHGNHGKESTRGIVNAEAKNHPILRGVRDIWGPTDVYGIQNYPDDARTLVFGQVLQGMNSFDSPVSGPKNDPMMPVAWIRYHKNEAGTTNRIFTTTMGAANDLQSEGLRRLIVNACYWGAGLSDQIPLMSKVDYVSEYQPSNFGFNGYRKGRKPSDFVLPE